MAVAVLAIKIRDVVGGVPGGGDDEGGADVNTIPLKSSVVDYSDGPQTDVISARTGISGMEIRLRRSDVDAQRCAREGRQYKNACY